MSQPLAIVGASTRAAAASSVRAGFQPIAADLFADADLRRIATATRISPYPEGFVDWMRAIEPPAWMYTGAMENHPDLVDQLAWIAPLWGNPGDVLARVRSPWELSRVLASASLLFPEIRATADGLPQNGSWLAKSCRGASGSGVLEWSETRRQGDKETGSESEVDAESTAPGLPVSLSPGLVYQQRIAGTPCAAVYVAAAGGAQLLGITRQLIGEPWLGAHGFQFAGSIGPWPVSDAVHNTLVQIGNLLAEQFELIGLFGVDFMLDGDHVWTLEVNPRYTASVEIVERFSGVNAIAAHAIACGMGNGMERAGRSSAPIGGEDAPARSAHGKAVLFAKQDLTISAQFAEMSLSESVKTPWPTLADVSPAGTPVEVGRPILTIFAEAESVELVELQLRERVQGIESFFMSNSR